MQPIIAFFQQHSKRITIAIVAMGLLVLASRWVLPGTAQPPETPAAIAEPDDTFAALQEDAAVPPPTPAPPIIAYVSGAVREPDVYTLPAEARIKDLVLAAGGLLQNADAERINLAERITDGQHIKVPFQGEPAAEAGAAASNGAAPPAGAPLNINTASLDELDQLDGIGKVLAQRIIDYRNTNGPFTSVGELGNVKGISAALLAALSPQLSAQP